MRIAFMGTPEFAVPSLQALHETWEVALVVTNPDRPKGRGRRLQASPVKQYAEQEGLEVFQPRSLKKPEVMERLGRVEPDVIVVAAYGKILPPRILALPRLGCVNVHASLLPKYRGAAPIQWAIIRGEQETGVTIMLMDEGLDTGPILATASEAILPEDTAGSLSERLAKLGARLLVETLPRYASGEIQPRPQPAQGATRAPMLRKEDGWVDFGQPAQAVANRIRGTDPWPGAYCLLAGERLKLFGARPTSGSAAPGTVLGLENRALVVACGQDAVAISELQLPGRRRMSAEALCAGRPMPSGTVLGGRPSDEEPHAEKT